MTKKNQPRHAEQCARPHSDSRVQKKSGHSSTPDEIGGFQGPEPTRYGDWEKNGHCIDF